MEFRTLDLNEAVLLALCCIFFVALVVYAVLNELEILHWQGQAPSRSRGMMLKEKTRQRMPLLTALTIAGMGAIVLVGVQQGAPWALEALFVFCALVSLAWFLLLSMQIRREEYYATHPEHPHLAPSDARRLRLYAYHRDEAERLRNLRIVPMLGLIAFGILAVLQFLNS